MRKINCIIVDDQQQSVDLIRDYIDNIPLLSLKFEATNPILALDFLDRERIDCIFLDIDMPQMSGLEFIETLKSKHGNKIPKVILITGYDRYAISGFDYGVFDYLLKPVNFKRFKIAVDRLTNVFDLNRKDEVNFFFIDVSGEKIKVNFGDINYIEAAGNYSLIYTGDEKLMSYKTLNALQDVLPDSKFIRVHKSFIVAVEKIQSVKGNEVMITTNNIIKNIPVGVTYKEKFLKSLRIIL